MRDLIAGIVAALLFGVALSLIGILRAYQRRQQLARTTEQARGRRIIAELPTASDLILFTEDDTHFHYGARAIDKGLVTAVRVLINGSPIAAYVSPRWPPGDMRQPTSFEDRPEGIARDHWDVAIEMSAATELIPCGAIRERVSQELARTIFEAVKQEMERRDAVYTGR